MKAALPARDPRGDGDGVQRKQKLNCINVRDGERIDTEGDEGVATFDGKSLRWNRKLENGEQTI